MNEFVFTYLIFLIDKKTDKRKARNNNFNYEILKASCHSRTLIKYMTSWCKQGQLIRRITVKIYIKAAKLKGGKLTAADITDNLDSYTLDSLKYLQIYSRRKYSSYYEKGEKKYLSRDIEPKNLNFPMRYWIYYLYFGYQKVNQLESDKLIRNVVLFSNKTQWMKKKTKWYFYKQQKVNIQISGIELKTYKINYLQKQLKSICRNITLSSHFKISFHVNQVSVRVYIYNKGI